MAGTIIPADLEIDMDGTDPDQPGDIKIVKGTVLELDDCDATTIWTVQSGAGVTISLDNAKVREGTGSIKVNVPAGITAIVKATKASGSWDISLHNYLRFSLSQKGGPLTTMTGFKAYFGETAYNDQGPQALTAPGISWTDYGWLISGIAAASRNAVTIVAFEATAPVGASFFNIDYVYAAPGPSKIKAYDGDATIQLSPKFQSGIYTATTEAPRTITLNKSGTPSHIRIQNITTGDATANDEVVWYSGMTQYYAARTGGAVAPSTDMVIDVGDSYFTVATDDRVNQATKNYGYCVMWNDTTG